MERIPGSKGVIFSLSASSQAQGSPDLLGPWVASTTMESAGLSFAGGEGSSMEPELPEGSIWRSDLPLDVSQIDRSFEQAEDSLATVQTALVASRVQVEAMIQRQTSGTSFANPPSSEELFLFDLLPSAPTMTAGLPQSEREKLIEEQRQRLRQLERDTLGMLSFSIKKEEISGESFSAESGWDEVNFGALDDISSKWNRASSQFQDFIDRLGQAIGNFAWVETRIGGELMARTSVGWNGDMDTRWITQPDPEQVHQHERTLQLALASRIMLLRTFATVSTNAVKLSVLAAAPGGAILALPASLSLVNQIINEQARYQQQIKEIQNGD